MTDVPIYKSKRSGRNLWQEYRIFPDRLELQSWALFHTVVIPANEILEIDVRPGVIGKQGFFPQGITVGTKLDMADLFPHVLIRKKSGLVKRIAFTPDDPEKFVAECKSILR